MKHARVLLVLFVLTIFAGCITEETKLLVQGIHQYHVKQEVALKKWDQLTDQEKQEVIEDSAALVRSTLVLQYTIGKPKDVE